MTTNLDAKLENSLLEQHDGLKDFITALSNAARAAPNSATEVMNDGAEMSINEHVSNTLQQFLHSNTRLQKLVTQFSEHQSICRDIELLESQLGIVNDTIKSYVRCIDKFDHLLHKTIDNISINTANLDAKSQETIKTQERELESINNESKENNNNNNNNTNNDDLYDIDTNMTTNNTHEKPKFGENNNDSNDNNNNNNKMKKGRRKQRISNINTIETNPFTHTMVKHPKTGEITLQNFTANELLQLAFKLRHNSAVEPFRSIDENMATLANQVPSQPPSLQHELISQSILNQTPNELKNIFLNGFKDKIKTNREILKENVINAMLNSDSTNIDVTTLDAAAAGLAFTNDVTGNVTTTNMNANDDDDDDDDDDEFGLDGLMG